jgi:thioredoxin 1
MVYEVTDANLKELLAGAKPVVVDCWAPWCGPCKMMHPVIDEVAAETEGKVIVGKLNVDENPEVCELFGIMNIPTILLFKNGELVDRQVGYCPKPKLLPLVEALA